MIAGDGVLSVARMESVAFYSKVTRGNSGHRVFPITRIKAAIRYKTLRL